MKSIAYKNGIFCILLVIGGIGSLVLFGPQAWKLATIPAGETTKGILWALNAPGTSISKYWNFRTMCEVYGGGNTSEALSKNPVTLPRAFMIPATTCSGLSISAEEQLREDFAGLVAPSGR